MSNLLGLLVSGTAWGYLESFLFWFLQDLGGSNILMGLTITVGGLAGVPLLICSRPIIKQFGHVNILCLGLVFYAVRLIGELRC
jgi:MFS family permease